MNDLPEAAAVAFTKLRTPKGFVWSYTVRASSHVELSRQMIELEDEWAEAGYTPEEDRRGPGRPPKYEAPTRAIETPEQREIRETVDEAVDTQAGSTCPMHGVPMKTTPWGSYSHGEKQPDGSWLNCYGQGWKAKKR